MQLLSGISNDLRAALTHALYRAYWVDNLDISSPAVLQTILAKLSSGSTIVYDSQKLRDNTQEAFENGAPGVPSFYIPETKRLFWGQDRMHFVEAYLAGGKEWSKRIPSVKLLSMIDFKVKPRGDGIKRRLKFWYDVASPWSYIGYTQLEKLQRDTGCHIECKPIFLGMLFKEINVATLPMAAMSENKRNNFVKDMMDYIKWHSATNQPVQFQWPEKFPIRTVVAQRVLILEPKALKCLFEACWGYNINVSDEVVLQNVLDKAGFDGKDLIQGTKDNRNGCKDTLRLNNEEAVKLGLFGVPTFQVDDGEPIFGQDRLNVVQDLLLGWKFNDSHL